MSAISKPEPARELLPPAGSPTRTAAGRAFLWPRGPVLLRVCSWCQSFLGTKPGGGVTKTQITHGICQACTARLMAEGAAERAANGDDARPHERAGAWLVIKALAVWAWIRKPWTR